MKSPIKAFRRGVEAFKAICKAVPVVVDELKHHSEREILRAKVHQIVDKGIEMYGDTAVAMAKTVDVEMIASAAFDFIALIEKWKEPMKLQAVALNEALKPIHEKFNTETNTITKEAGLLFKKISEELKWEERFTPEAEKLAVVEDQAKYHDDWKAAAPGFKFYEKLRNEDREKPYTQRRSVRLTELETALKGEAKSFFIRKEGETTNEYWLRCKNGPASYETKFDAFVDEPLEKPTTEKKAKTKA